jgi:hypothetical protein
MIEKHRADEIRHGQLFRSAAARTGIVPGPVPKEIQILEQLDRRLGFLGKPVTDDAGVMQAYLILQVLEERAVCQFSLLEIAFREVDLETAAIFGDVAQDERRHLKYCVAISRRYAPDESTRLTALENLRREEAEAYREVSRAFVQHAVSLSLLGPPRRSWGWRALSAASQWLVKEPPFTTFGRLHLETAAAEAA